MAESGTESFTPGGSVPDDARALAEASAAIRAACGWHVWPVITETLTLDGSGSRILLLPSLRVVAVDNVTVCDKTLTADDFDWSAKGYLRLRSPLGRFTDRPRGVTATLTHGFERVDDLAVVARSWATAWAKQPRGRVASETSGPDSVSYALPSVGATSGGGAFATLDPREQATLARYTLPPRP